MSANRYHTTGNSRHWTTPRYQHGSRFDVPLERAPVQRKTIDWFTWPVRITMIAGAGIVVMHSMGWLP